MVSKVPRRQALKSFLESVDTVGLQVPRKQESSWQLPPNQATSVGPSILTRHILYLTVDIVKEDSKTSALHIFHSAPSFRMGPSQYPLRSTTAATTTTLPSSSIMDDDENKPPPRKAPKFKVANKNKPSHRKAPKFKVAPAHCAITSKQTFRPWSILPKFTKVPPLQPPSIFQPPLPSFIQPSPFATALDDNHASTEIAMETETEMNMLHSAAVSLSALTHAMLAGQSKRKREMEDEVGMVPKNVTAQVFFAPCCLYSYDPGSRIYVLPKKTRFSFKEDRSTFNEPPPSRLHFWHPNRRAVWLEYLARKAQNWLAGNLAQLDHLQTIVDECKEQSLEAPHEHWSYFLSSW
jgi:hypothetical protein